MEEKVYCYNCGKDIEKSDQFCPYCGAEQCFADSETLGEIETIKPSTGNSEERKPKQKRTILICIIVASVCLVGLIGFLLLKNSSVEVPDLSGMTLEEATECGQEFDLTVKKGEMLVGEKKDEGTVVKQSPKAGTDVKKGTAITVNICSGPGDGTVPNLVNLTMEEAQDKIKNMGFKVGNINQIASAEKAGTVLDQNPKANAVIEKGKRIDIDISDGTLITVPNLIGKDEVNAKKALDNCGLKGEPVDVEYSTKVDYGCVIKQNPAGGTAVKRGSTVQLWFSIGSEDEQDLYYYDSPPGQYFYN